MTVHDLDDVVGGGAGACREYKSPRDDEDSCLTGWIPGHTQVGPLLEVKVAYHSDWYGIEVRVKFLTNDGSLSWIVISPGLNKYVDQLYEEQGQSFSHEEMASCSGMEKPVATKHKGQSSPQ